MDVEDGRTIGARLRRVRDDRDKSLRVIAGLAGMDKSTLSRIERGERSPTLNELVALTDVLQISMSELIRLPVPAPANGHTDSTTKAIGLALDAIEIGHPGGLVLPVAVLRDRVTRLHQHKHACRLPEVAAELPGLVRDVHTTLATGADHGEVLELAVYLHTHVTYYWLVLVAAPNDLMRRVAFLARRLAQERDEVTTLGVAGLKVADTLIGEASELAKTELDSLTLPPTTAATAGLVVALTTYQATAAAWTGRPGEAAAAMDAAADLAGRFGELGETDPLGCGEYGPTFVGFQRVRLALEVGGEPDRAVSIAEGLHPERHPFPVNRAAHWMAYGQALAQLRGRRDDAVRALRRAETMNPIRVRRHPFVRDTIAVLLPGARRDAVGQELRDMAVRVGLAV
ncbi:MAG: helix-turn-helix domain-containing protein [Pseudonocardiaceae bacterium]